MQAENTLSSPTWVLEHDLTTIPSVVIGPPVYGHQTTEHNTRDKSKDITIASNVSELELSNLFKLSKITCIAKLTMLTKLVLKGNDVTTFPSMSKLPLLLSVHISNMHKLKSVGKAVASAPALRSLDVHNCRVFTTITNSFIAGVTSVGGMDSARTSLRFHTLRVTRCPLVIPRQMGDLAGLRVLYLADTFSL